MKIKLLSLLAILLLSGCMSAPPQNWKVISLGTIDKDKKVMFTSKNNSGFIGVLKDALRNDNWKITTVRTDGDITKGTIEGDVYLERKEVLNAHYELSSSLNIYNGALDFLITDLKSGNEVLIITQNAFPNYYEMITNRYELLADDIIFEMKKIEK